MNILAGPYSSRVTKKGNKGLSGVAIIDTSHIGRSEERRGRERV